MRKYKIEDIPKNVFNLIENSIEKNGFILDIRNTSFLKEGGICGGYFDGKNIVVAKNSKRSGYILLHEWVHSLQLAENNHLWEDYNPWSQPFDIKRFPSYLNLILLERDCEKRVISFAKRHKLFNIEDYAKASNAYLFKYHFMFFKGGWVSFKQLYCKEILDKMPSKIVSEKALKTIDMDLMLLYNNVYESQRK
jgi:hypothetical protein